MPLFEKGNGFSKGRPRGSGAVQVCRDFAENDGFAKLIGVALGKPMPWRERRGKMEYSTPTQELQFEALKLLLAYGIGKPTQYHEVNNTVNSVADWALRHFGADASRASPV